MEKQKYLTPSGLTFVLREQTGADDDVINGAMDEATMVNTYLANVIEEGPDGKRMDAEGVKKLRLGDKYFLVLASRILSLGPTLWFKYTWREDQPPVEYQEDLNRYIWDYTKPFPKFGDPDYFDQRIPPYPEGDFISVEIGGHKLRMDYVDGYGEAYMLGLPANKRTVNQELIARNFRIFKDGEWKRVVNFGSFSAKAMVQIRNLVHDFDPPNEGLMTLTNPETLEIIKVPILGVKDFFFPVKI